MIPYIPLIIIVVGMLGVALPLVNYWEREEDEALRERRRIVHRATEVFGNKKAAELWLSRPIPALDYRTPNELLSEKGGVEKVETLLGQIEHGIAA